MKDKIQKIISEMDAEKLKAIKACQLNMDAQKWYTANKFEAMSEAFDLCIQKLTLLLNTEREKQPGTEGE